MANVNLSFLEKFSLPGMREHGAISSSHAAVLARVNVSLVVFENTLINTVNGEYREFDATADNRSVAIAEAARSLLPSRDELSQEAHQVLLLLPSTEFVSTSYNIAVSGEKMLRSALELQAHTLIPAYEEPLYLGVNAKQTEGVALWLAKSTADSLFEAFNGQGLFLSAIMPRSLALLEKEADDEESSLEESAASDQAILIKDESQTHITALQIKSGAIQTLLSVNKRDLEQDVFAKQWEIECNQLDSSNEFISSSLSSWTVLRKSIEVDSHYSFLPEGAQQAGHLIESARRKKIGAGVGAFLLLMLCLPFLSSWFTIRSLENEVERYQLLSLEARNLQNSLYEMEEEWGALYEYPNLNISQTLLSLDEVIESSLLTFNVNKGLIDITGYAQDPAYLLEQLSEKEEFFDVTQSRSQTGSNSDSRGDRFGFRMNMSNVDFETYEEKYPLLEE